MSEFDSVPLLDEDTLEEIELMARQSGRDVLGSFLQRALDGEVLDLAVLRRCVLERDWGAAVTNLHRLKGTAGMYGLSRLAELASSLHDRVQVADLEPDELSRLEQIAKDSLGALRARLAK